MVWNIYLGTTAISWIVAIIFSTACENKLERKGYKFVKEKKSISEKIASFISIAFKSVIPIYNIVNAIGILCMGDKVYELLEDKLLKEGKIYIPTEEKENDEDRTFGKEMKMDEGMEKSNSKKAQDAMTSEERLSNIRNAQQTVAKVSSILEEAARVETGEKRAEDLSKLYADLFGESSLEEPSMNEDTAYQKGKRYR